MEITSFWQWKANKLNEPPSDFVHLLSLSLSFKIHLHFTLMTMASNYSPGFMRFYFIMSRYHSLSHSLSLYPSAMRQQRGNFFHYPHTTFTLSLSRSHIGVSCSTTTTKKNLLTLSRSTFFFRSHLFVLFESLLRHCTHRGGKFYMLVSLKRERKREKKREWERKQMRAKRKKNSFYFPISNYGNNFLCVWNNSCMEFFPLLNCSLSLLLTLHLSG